VVSAGLGGDDNAWLLDDLVCGVCNTNIFSKLETKFLRSSAAAWARLFLQEKGIRRRLDGASQNCFRANKAPIATAAGDMEFSPDNVLIGPILRGDDASSHAAYEAPTIGKPRR
jgi:hypothetical protein